jgi:hypothetical protein
VSPRDPRSRHRTWLAALVAAPLLLLALGLWLDPDPRGYGTHEQLGLQACPTREWLDIPCPACGLTTSVALTSHGRPLEALRAHPLGPALVLAAFGAAVWAVVQHRQRRDLSLLVAHARWRSWGPLLGLALALSWAFELIRARGGGA